MEAIEYLYAYTPEEYEELYNEIEEATASFDITKFYSGEEASVFIAITPNQLIAVPTKFHTDAGYKVYSLLYNSNDYLQTRNIVIYLSNSDSKVFYPYFPSVGKAINSFQAEVFLDFLEKLEVASNDDGYMINKDKNGINDIKDKFNKIPIDDSFIPPEENIISLTREDWNKKHKIA